MRPPDGADGLDAGVVVEQHAPAAVHLRIDETRDEPCASQVAAPGVASAKAAGLYVVGVAGTASADRLELADEVEPISGGIVTELIGVAADGAGEAQPVALALDRCDEGLTPAAEADDRGVDHRPARNG